MRKLFTLAVLAVVTMTASAQLYLGGSVGTWRNYDENTTSFQIAPEVGYQLDSKWAIGTRLGYAYSYKDGVKVNAVAVNPYARYTYAKLGNVNLFLDGGFGFATYKVKDFGDSQNAWEVGLKPGVSVNLTEKLSFVSHIGFFGYRDADDSYVENVFGEKGFGFDLDATQITFGLLWNF